jgi:hypothetical protein
MFPLGIFISAAQKSTFTFRFANNYRKRCGKNVTFFYKNKYYTKYLNLLPALILTARKKLPVPNIPGSWDLEDDAEMDADDMYHDTE